MASLHFDLLPPPDQRRALTLKRLNSDPSLRAALVPTKPKEEPKPKDWVLIAAIVALVATGLVTAFSVICLQGMLPLDLLGGYHNALITACVSGVLAAAAGATVFIRWKTKR